MTLQAGTRLGPYEISAPLGAGGMGEVYKARDTRLDRLVAIKVLPELFSANPDFRERFEREARAVSSLNHPNICTLHDVGHQDGVQYLVMEYLEGQSLADRLAKGALPLDSVLRFGTEIASALDKAHKHGIVHRDLKPGNIMITKSGAKLLDFGLAKLQPDSSSQAVVSGVSMLATEAGAKNLTAEGSIVGTFQYMSPEQLEGREIDTRTDIFAFGSVLYEMITGKKAFTGKSQASLIAAILERDPVSINEIQPMTPPALDRVVKTCLAKDPDDRWQTAHDVMLQLKWISDGTLTASAPAVATHRKSRKSWIPWLVAALSLALASAFAFFYFELRNQPPEKRRFMVTPPDNSGVSIDVARGFAISPDGKYLVFAGGSEKGRMLWLRSLDSFSAIPLDATKDAAFPFWSPDSKFVAYFTNGKLRRISIPDGVSNVICDASNGRGGAWSPDGTILFCPDVARPLHRVSAGGGNPEPVTKVRSWELGHRWPIFLPDGKRFLYFGNSQDRSKKSIFAGSLNSSETKEVMASDSMVGYVAGYLLLVREKTLVAQPFDDKNLELYGEQTPLVQNMQRYSDTGPTGYAPFSISNNHILVHGTLPVETQLVWFDRAGKILSKLPKQGNYFEPYFSPDQKRIVVGLENVQSSSQDIWIIDLIRGISSRFTFQRNSNMGSAVWSPDGTRIAYSTIGKMDSDMFVKEASGGNQEQILLDWKGEQWADDWSPDGRYLLFETFVDQKNVFDLWVIAMTGEKKTVPVVAGEFNQTHASFSPNGKWIAYVSDESGKAEVYVQGFMNPQAGKYQISTAGGDMPLWRKDGNELYYLATGGNLMSVEVKTDPLFEAGAPQLLFKTAIMETGNTSFRNQYLPSADGTRFLINELEQSSSNHLFVTLNWNADVPK